MDPAEHAAMHALLHGDWHGTLSGQGPAPTTLTLKVGADHAGKLTFQITGERSVGLGSASRLALEGDTLRWTQEVSGASCPSVAKVTRATQHDPETLKGTMTCARGEMAFALRRTN